MRIPTDQPAVNLAAAEPSEAIANLDLRESSGRSG